MKPFEKLHATFIQLQPYLHDVLWFDANSGSAYDIFNTPAIDQQLKRQKRLCAEVGPLNCPTAILAQRAEVARQIIQDKSTSDSERTGLTQLVNYCEAFLSDTAQEASYAQWWVSSARVNGAATSVPIPTKSQNAPSAPVATRQVAAPSTPPSAPSTPPSQSLPPTKKPRGNPLKNAGEIQDSYRGLLRQAEASANPAEVRQKVQTALQLLESYGLDKARVWHRAQMSATGQNGLGQSWAEGSPDIGLLRLLVGTCEDDEKKWHLMTSQEKFQTMEKIKATLKPEAELYIYNWVKAEMPRSNWIFQGIRGCFSWIFFSIGVVIAARFMDALMISVDSPLHEASSDSLDGDVLFRLFIDLMAGWILLLIILSIWNGIAGFSKRLMGIK